MSDSDSDSGAKNTQHHIKPSSEKPKLDTSNWPLLLKVRADIHYLHLINFQSIYDDSNVSKQTSLGKFNV
jgi:hypothetical protein